MPELTVPVRLVWADVARLISILAVVVLHSAAPLLVRYRDSGVVIWWIGNGYDSAVRWCVPLFVMLSGALLLGRSADPRRFLAKRVRKVVIPFAAWSVLYFYWAAWFHGRALDRGDLLPMAAAQPVYYHLWFFYMLLGLYLLAPLLDAYLRAASRRNVGYLLATWLAWASLLPTVEGLWKLKLYASPGAAATPLQFLGYFVLGYVLRDATLPGGVRPLLPVAFVAGVAATAVGTHYLTVTRGGGELDALFYEYHSPNVVLMSVALFLMLRGVRLPAWFEARPHVLRALSGSVLGVYLVHAMLIDLFKSGRLGFELHQSSVHPFVGVPLFAAAVFTASLAVVAVLRRIPLLKQLVP